MEYLLEIIVVAQCAVVLWLSYIIKYLDINLNTTMDAHNRLSDAFVALLDALDEDEYDDQSNLP